MSRQTILVIDGEPKNLQILQESLEKADFGVMTASSINEAWGILKSENVDLVVSEVDLPGMDGFQFLEKLQKDAALASTPLVFLTNRRNLDDRVRSLRAGVKDYMIKPLHVKEVIARLQMILRRMQRMKNDRGDLNKKLAGRLEDQSVEQLIENYGAERKTGRLTVYDEDNHSGEIYFREGAVINARLGNFKAEKAVYQMLPWRRGHFIMMFQDINVNDEISVSNLGLLLQGFKRLQERDKLIKQLPSFDTVFAKTPLFEKLIQKKKIDGDALKFVSLFDGKRTVRDVLIESTYDDLKSLERISKLYQKNFIRSIDEQPPTEQRAREILDAESGTLPQEQIQEPAPDKPEVPAPEPQQTKTPEPETAEFEPVAAETTDAEAIEPEVEETEEQTPEPEQELEIEPDLQVQSNLTEPAQDTPEKKPISEPAAFEQAPLETEEDEAAAKPEETEADSETHISQPPPFSFETPEPPPSPVNGRIQLGEEKPERSKPGEFAELCKQLLLARKLNQGRLVIISSENQDRKDLVGVLTDEQFHTKTVDPETDTTLEIGKITASDKRAVDIIGLSTERKFLQLIEQLTDNLIGYIVLLRGDNSNNLDYLGYLLNTLKSKMRAPGVLAVYNPPESKTMPLDFIRYSLNLDESEQIVNLEQMDVASLQHLLKQLTPPVSSPKASPNFAE